MIAGPTAIGKSQLAIDLAKEFSCEILSADSRQFYQEMSIGTAKPTAEEMQNIPHHFINNISIQQDYNVGKFELEALQKLEELFQKNDVAILVGGSGLYINALLYGLDDLPPSDEKIRLQLEKDIEEKGIEHLQNQLQQLDPVYFKEVDIHNKHRVMRALEICLISGYPYSSLRINKKVERPFKSIFIVLNSDRKELYNKINLRVDLMLQNGLLKEVQSLIDYQQHNALNTVGYKEIFDYLNGKTSLEFAIDKIKQNSRNYAKRQITWFKKNEEAIWFEPTQKEEIIQLIRRVINFS